MEDYKYYQDIHINCQRVNVSMMSSLRPSPVLPLPSVSQPLPIPFDKDIVGVSRNASDTAAASRRLLAAIEQQQMGQPHQRRVTCSDAEPNTALLTAIIMSVVCSLLSPCTDNGPGLRIATFMMAFMLKKLRESFYLGRHVSSHGAEGL